MIHKVDGQDIAEAPPPSYLFQCDSCGEEADLRKEGWRISKDGDTWIHTCPDCRDER